MSDVVGLGVEVLVVVGVLDTVGDTVAVAEGGAVCVNVADCVGVKVFVRVGGTDVGIAV